MKVLFGAPLPSAERRQGWSPDAATSVWTLAVLAAIFASDHKTKQTKVQTKKVWANPYHTGHGTLALHLALARVQENVRVATMRAQGYKTSIRAHNGEQNSRSANMKSAPPCSRMIVFIHLVFCVAGAVIQRAGFLLSSSLTGSVQSPVRRRGAVQAAETAGG